jgi:hypothetical protein
MNGYVYAISNEAGEVKIGFSTNPHGRLKGLQAHEETTLTLLGYARGTMAHEKEAQRLLAHARVRGEWFDPSDKIVHALVSMLPKPGPAPTKADRAAIRAHCTRVLDGYAKKAGVALSEVLRSLNANTSGGCGKHSGWLVPGSFVRVVEEKTGIPPHVIRPDLYPAPEAT